MNIREYRIKLGLTQAQIAEKLNVGSNAVSQWETGTRSPNVRHIQMLAEVFGCSVDKLLGSKKGGSCNDCNS
jgi:transcriptional regulator with XRE-family HTH domain